MFGVKKKRADGSVTYTGVVPTIFLSNQKVIFLFEAQKSRFISLTPLLFLQYGHM